MNEFETFNELKEKYYYEFKRDYGHIMFESIVSKIRNSSKSDRLFQLTAFKRMMPSSEEFMIVAYKTNLLIYFTNNRSKLIIAGFAVLEKWIKEVNDIYSIASEKQIIDKGFLIIKQATDLTVKL